MQFGLAREVDRSRFNLGIASNAPLYVRVRWISVRSEHSYRPMLRHLFVPYVLSWIEEILRLLHGGIVQSSTFVPLISSLGWVWQHAAYVQHRENTPCHGASAPPLCGVGLDPRCLRCRVCRGRKHRSPALLARSGGSGPPRQGTDSAGRAGARRRCSCALPGVRASTFGR